MNIPSREILDLLESEYPFELRRKEIINRVSFGDATISAHLKRLVRCGRIEKIKMQKGVKYRFKVGKANGY